MRMKVADRVLELLVAWFYFFIGAPKKVTKRESPADRWPTGLRKGRFRWNYAPSGEVGKKPWALETWQRRRSQSRQRKESLMAPVVERVAGKL